MCQAPVVCSVCRRVDKSLLGARPPGRLISLGKRSTAHDVHTPPARTDAPPPRHRRGRTRRPHRARLTPRSGAGPRGDGGDSGADELPDRAGVLGKQRRIGPGGVHGSRGHGRRGTQGCRGAECRGARGTGAGDARSRRGETAATGRGRAARGGTRGARRAGGRGSTGPPSCAGQVSGVNVTGRRCRPRMIRPPRQRSSSAGRARRTSGKRRSRVPIAIWPSRRASGAPMQ